MTLRERWAKDTERTERELSRLLAGKNIHPRLAEAMRYSVMAGGKRLRPMLVLSAARLSGGAEGEARALPLAAGAHHVALTYETPGLRTGAIVSLAALAVLLLWTFAARRARRKK